MIPLIDPSFTRTFDPGVTLLAVVVAGQLKLTL